MKLRVLLSSLMVLGWVVTLCVFPCSAFAGPHEHHHHHSNHLENGNGSGEVIEYYLEIHKALSRDSFQDTKAPARKLLTAMEDAERADMAAAAKALVAAESIEQSRASFKKLSDAMISKLKENPPAGRVLYEVSCPMAFSNQGAAWLQAETEVQNPYFGASMYSCGSTQGSIGSHADHHHHQLDRTTALPAGARTIEIEGREFEFIPAEITVRTGEAFRLKLVNKGRLPHMWEIEGRPETHVHAEVGETAVGVITAPEQPGEYRTVCTAEGHTGAGMVGKLVVRETAD